MSLAAMEGGASLGGSGALSGTVATGAVSVAPRGAASLETIVPSGLTTTVRTLRGPESSVAASSAPGTAGVVDWSPGPPGRMMREISRLASLSFDCAVSVAMVVSAGASWSGEPWLGSARS
jgi:hypothetical protein